ncbi:hypothetical protein PSTG_06188 [Puccinia striiformis f. sp. tritici PST-78]|uniref:Uncharacterized protein n=1 Tax=Puccinia striiformis f. sp. tritici PST-78 TaxID=1165861 RepID=A0A0L0VMS4_9BASI|nr:hypothetical protein PSTG_06188 [Puccinia striiformis f. sp. tritici PST-78]
MRKVLRAEGTAGQGTALTNQVEANPDPQKLLQRISTNQKDLALKDRIGVVSQTNVTSNPK